MAGNNIEGIWPLRGTPLPHPPPHRFVFAKDMCDVCGAMMRERVGGPILPP